MSSDVEEREELHRSIVQGSPNPIFLVDVRDQRVVDANPAFFALLDRTPDDLERLHLSDIDAADEEHLDALLLELVELHHEILGERTYIRADGEEVEVEVSANLVLHEGRRVVCFFARDITARRRAQEERQRLERQLWFSQKHEAVGRLATGVAHDFNNILMAIVLNCAVVERGLDDASQEELEALEEIREAGFKARDLTRQLLAFSGKQRLKLRPLSLTRRVEELEKLLRRTLGEQVRLDTDLEEELWPVRADPTQMDQVLLNLAVNARDAMPEGGTITIRTRNVELDEEFSRTHPSVQPGPHVLLGVEDTGEGMDPATRERLFEPFFTTKEQGKGTGLGLATVYGIVKQSQGTIWVRSEPGVGTAFDLYFPRLAQDVDVETETDAPAGASLPQGTEGVLVVEDDEAVRSLTGRILRSLGYGVVEAATPSEALRLHESLGSEARDGGHPVDLVLTDVVMPEMSGPELVRHLRGERPELPVVYMSGYADPAFDPDGTAGSSVPLMHKPFTAPALARTLRAALDGT